MVSFVIPVVTLNSSFWKKVDFLRSHLEQIAIGPFEIIIVPNGQAALADSSPVNFECLKIIPRISEAGKGRAVQTGFRVAKGSSVFMIDADLPYELGFIEKALELLDLGSDLVYSNRRHPDSYFRVKVPTLYLAFRRHCFGLMFNYLARLFLGVRSKDTQAGMKALSRRLAKEVAERATCPGFLFDLEIFLLAQSNGWKISDLAVVFNLENEKSSVRLVKETLAIMTWLPRIRWNLTTGLYHPQLHQGLASQTV